MEFEEKFLSRGWILVFKIEAAPYHRCIEFCCYFLCSVNWKKERASVVGIATRYELDGQGTEFR